MGDVPNHLRIATRGSALAVAQATIVGDALAKSGVWQGTWELVRITTRGDEVQDRPLYEVGGKGLFTTGVDEAVLEGRADLAVHSLKDVPTHQDFESGPLALAVPPRAAVADVLVCRAGEGGDGTMAGLAPGARVGTSALRRAALVAEMRADVQCLPVRGNVDTRLRLLTEGKFDALVLAAAGLARLGVELSSMGLTASRLPPEEFVPAAGQGALGVVSVRGSAAAQISMAIDDAAAHHAVLAERAVANGIGATCHSAVGVWARKAAIGWKIDAFVGPGAGWVGGGGAIRVEGETVERVLERLHALGAGERSRHWGAGA